MLTISNQALTVSISAQGAELQSIFNKHTQLEYLWDANPAFWPKKSPALFPIVGGLKNGVYAFEGKQYPLGRHGFARESVFSVSEQTESSIVLSLEANAKTRAVYPFEFKFSLAYRVEGNQLFVTYLVENTGDKDLFFSVGAHPAFKVPLTNGTSYEDWFLEFGTIESVGVHPLDAEGLVEPIAVPYLDNCKQLPLKKSLFYMTEMQQAVTQQKKSNHLLKPLVS
jgi:galactose mutarotase-like enzyme